jgi:hypothetical protein
MPNSTLGALTAATAATGGLFYGTQSGADRKFTFTAAGATLIEAADAAAQRTALAVLPLTGGTLTGALINSTNGAASAPVVSLTGTTFTGGTATTTKPTLIVEPSGTTSTNWSTSGTLIGANAANGFVGNLIDAQINGVSRFTVTVSSGWTAGGNIIINPNFGGAGRIRFGGTSGAFLNPGSVFSVGSTTAIGWTATTDGAGNSAEDLILRRDDANILAQRNGTNAQTKRVYGTYTDASNYVRASLAASSTLVTLAAETAGTGADNVDINITTAGTGLVNLATQSASVDAVSASTHTARIKIGGTEYKILLSTI